jgi:GTP diphosphokinase / guanosine-3',5'-bis(diphosphate) 3'-diphosphatase
MIKLYELNLEEKCPYGTDKDKDFDVLNNICRNNIPDYNEDLIKKAYFFAYNVHKNDVREDKTPYYTHPLKVAISLVKDFKLFDNNSIAAALLHDTSEDHKEVGINNIRELFNPEIAQIVDSLTKIKGKYTQNLDKAATYEKLFLALVKNPRVIMIKLSDRLDNMRTLQYMEERKQKRIGEETLNFYVPLAYRLGLNRITKDLELLSLYFNDRSAYNEIRPVLAQKREEFMSNMLNFHNLISRKLDERNIKHAITIEHKHEYEIYRMIQNGMKLEDIDNFYSMVIVLRTNDYTECYRVYGIIANLFGPVLTFDDFIARPKVNFYRALHSLHIGPGGVHIEVITRTDEMDKIADGGISALYTMDKVQKVPALEEQDVLEWIDWMKTIIIDGDTDAIQKIWGSIRMNLYEDEISVHDLEGKIYSLPKGSCPVDFSFLKSKQTGLETLSVKINHEVKTLEYELKNNDLIEIITSPNAEPQIEWLDNVITHKAIVALNKYFKENPPKKNKVNESEQPQLIRIRITGEDRPGLLHDITKEIGKINIQRINIYTSDAILEGAFTLKVQNQMNINTLIAKLLVIKGLRGVERIYDV